jgi:glycosyltransferase involved in cell wall biosynthesis
MIARNAEETLEACLRSVRPWVDEVNIYLAGESTDGTVALVERLASKPGPPIRCVQGEWHDDFAWARNQSFAMVSPDAGWIVCADADDVLHCGAGLRWAVNHAVQHWPKVNAFVVPYMVMRKDAISAGNPPTDRWYHPVR